MTGRGCSARFFPHGSGYGQDLEKFGSFSAGPRCSTEINCAVQPELHEDRQPALDITNWGKLVYECALAVMVEVRGSADCKERRCIPRLSLLRLGGLHRWIYAS